jgi:GAF domain-containing protein
MKCPRCQHDGRSAAKFCEECATPFALPKEGDPPAASYGELQRALTEALDQQTATSEILRVISGSPTDLQPVMAAIVETAARLAEAEHAMIGRAEGDVIRWLATYGTTPATSTGQPITRNLPTGRAILDRQTTQIEDVANLAREFPETVGRAYRERGVRTILATPLLREGVAVGVLLLRRTVVQPFTDQQIALLKTFADQAVIAIENVRLFTELQTSNRDLTTALDTQTATSEILRVISSSPTDVLPVFDTIVRSAARLCHAVMASVLLTDGRMLYLPANYGSSPEALAAVRARFPRPLDTESVSGAAIMTRSVVHVPDVLDPSVFEFTRQTGQVLGYRSLVAVPMFREGGVVGAINVCRREPGRFSDAEVELLKTFADQAVIAIENVRLFKELQHRNEALTAAHAEVTDALAQQRATSDILRVISGSATDVLPVFDAILQSALTLCDAPLGVVLRLEHGMLHLVAYKGPPRYVEIMREGYPQPLRRDRISGLAILERRAVHATGLSSSKQFPHAQALAHAAGFDSTVFVPILRDGDPIGAIGVGKGDAFTDKHIGLLGTFVAIIMAIGSSFAAMNTMYAAVARRSAEIGTLRVLGFSKLGILTSFFLESLLLSLIGGIIGCLLVLPLNNFQTGIGNFVTFSEITFEFRVTPAIMMIGVVFAFNANSHAIVVILRLSEHGDSCATA